MDESKLNSADLVSLVLTLRPLPRRDPTAPLPTWWGRAAHALLLNTTRQYDPRLAESLHSPPGGEAEGDQQSSSEIRPFTASTLMGRFPHGALQDEQPYLLRLTAFRQELAAILIRAAQDGPLAPGRTIELDFMPFQVQNVQPSLLPDSQPATPDSQSAIPDSLSPWASITDYAGLSASLLLSRQPAPRRVSLQLTSPTTFKTGGKHLPLPLPELVFGSLLERWNAYAPIAFPPEARRYAAECLAVSRYHLSTRSTPVKSGGLRVGAVGEVTYTSLNYDRYWMSLVGVLASFALFAGVGAGTSMGLGQCRAIGEPSGEDRLD